MSKLLLTAIAVALIRIPPSMAPETGCDPATHVVVMIDLRVACGTHPD